MLQQDAVSDDHRKNGAEIGADGDLMTGGLVGQEGGEIPNHDVHIHEILGRSFFGAQGANAREHGAGPRAVLNHALRRLPRLVEIGRLRG